MNAAEAGRTNERVKTIKSKRSLTDPWMLVATFVATCAAIVAMVNSKDFGAGKEAILSAFSSRNAYDSGLRLLLAPFLAGFLFTEICILLFRACPIFMLHAGFIGLGLTTFGLSILALAQGEALSGLFAMFAGALVAFLYWKSVKYFKMVSLMMVAVSKDLLVNPVLILVFVAGGVLSGAGIGTVLPLMFLAGREGQYILKAVSVLYYFWMIIAVAYSAKVFFSRGIYVIAENRAVRSNKSIVGESVLRTLLSSGTILLASFLVALVETMKYFMRQGRHQARERSEENAAMAMLMFVLHLIAEILLSALGIMIEALNSFVLCYNALFGASYAKSIEASMRMLEISTRPIIPKTTSLVGMASLGIVFSLLIFCFVWIEVAFGILSRGGKLIPSGILDIHKAIEDNIATIILTLQFCVIVTCTLSIVPNCVLAVDMLRHSVPALFDEAYPGLEAGLRAAAP